jgi:hypothetical protein
MELEERRMRKSLRGGLEGRERGQCQASVISLQSSLSQPPLSLGGGQKGCCPLGNLSFLLVEMWVELGRNQMDAKLRKELLGGMRPSWMRRRPYSVPLLLRLLKKPQGVNAHDLHGREPFWGGSREPT